jgi:hypothetical protein
MSAGGRYIPVNSAYASPVIEKAGLGERRGVRGALLRKDTAEAGESTFCLEFIMGSVSLYHASAHDILTDKDVLAFETPLPALLPVSKVSSVASVAL